MYILFAKNIKTCVDLREDLVVVRAFLGGEPGLFYFLVRKSYYVQRNIRNVYRTVYAEVLRYWCPLEPLLSYSKYPKNQKSNGQATTTRTATIRCSLGGAAVSQHLRLW